MTREYFFDFCFGIRTLKVPGAWPEEIGPKRQTFFTLKIFLRAKMWVFLQK
jgi:hypothetical protein